MSEEVSVLNDYQVHVFPAPIERVEITNMDALVETLNNLIEKYQNLVVTPDTKKDTKKIIAQLRKLKKEINAKKISVKKQLEEPIKAYEDQAKKLMTVIDSTIDPLAKKVSEIEQQEKDERHQESLNLIKEMAPNYDLTPDEIEFDPEWDNQITTSKRTKLIGDHMGYLQLQKKQLATEKAAVESFAKSKKLQPTPFLQMVNDGFSFGAIKDRIEATVAEMKEEDQRKQNKAESQKAIEKMKENLAKTIETSNGDVKIDPETGEIINSSRSSEPEIKPVETFTRAFKVTGTRDQLWALSNEMDNLGIKYEKIAI